MILGPVLGPNTPRGNGQTQVTETAEAPSTTLDLRKHPVPRPGGQGVAGSNPAVPTGRYHLSNMCLMAGEPKGELNLNPASLPVRQVRLQRSPPTRAFVRPAPPAPRHGLDSVKGSRLRKDSSDQAINSIAFEQVKGSHPRTPGRQRRCALPQVRGLINDLGLSLGSSRSPSQISLTRCTGDSGTTAPVRDVCRMDPLAWAQGRPGHHTDHLAS